MSTYITKQMRIQALSVDLYEWLLKHHPDDVHTRYGSVLLNADDHVSVKAGYHGYFNWRTGESGNAIDYLMSFLGYSYQSAVLALTEDEYPDTGVQSDCPHTGTPESGSMTSSDDADTAAQTHAPFTLPDKAQSYRRAFAYLTKQRSIPPSMVQQLIDRHLMYESDRHNIVFVNSDATYYELRGTNTYADERCRHRDKCSRFTECEHGWCMHAADCPDYKKSPFHGTRSVDETKFWYMQPYQYPVESVYICEGAIDAVSLCVMHLDHGITNAGYAAIGGAAKQVKIDWIVRHTGGNVVIATDNDDAGDSARSRNSDLRTIRPATHDWNDDLKTHIYYAESITRG